MSRLVPQQLWIMLAAALWCGPITARAAEVFVSPQGNDAWSGKLPEANQAGSDGPVATLKKARDLIRAAKRRAAKSDNPNEPMIVTLRGGRYPITETFALAAGDSGTEAAPLTFRAYQTEQPIITSAVEVKEFQPLSGNILKATLPESLDPAKVRLVLYQGKRLPMARYPNADPSQPVAGGWAYVDGQRPPRPSEKIAGESEANRSLLTVRRQDVRSWRNPAEGELFIFTRYNYWNDLVGIESFNANQAQLKTAAPSHYAIRPGDRYFVQGLREELDAPGEWYVDQQSRSLLIYANSNQPRMSLDIASSSNLLTLRQGTTNVRFEKLVFECCTDSAIHLIECQRCTLIGCTVRHLGDVAASGIYVQAGEQNLIDGCDIWDIGGNGIQISGGDYKTLAPSNHKIENCHIHHTGIITKRSAGIWLTGVGITVSRNSVHHCPRAGIMMQFGGANQKNLIESNHVYETCLETQDSGAIYASGRDWISNRGNVIRTNHIHDARGFGFDENRWVSPYYAIGIYLDDACSNVEVFGNIIARSSRAGILVHSGRNNRIMNNIIIDGGESQIELRGWKSNQSNWQTALPAMKQRYAEVKSEAAWQEFAGFGDPTQAVTDDDLIMVDNVLQNNIVTYSGRNAFLWDVWNLPVQRFQSDANILFTKTPPPLVRLDNRKLDFNRWQSAGFDRRSVLGDPRLKQTGQSELELAANSPAFATGFKALPLDKIGPYSSPTRATWPLVEQ